MGSHHDNDFGNPEMNEAHSVSFRSDDGGAIHGGRARRIGALRGESRRAHSAPHAGRSACAADFHRGATQFPIVCDGFPLKTKYAPSSELLERALAAMKKSHELAAETT